LAGIHQLVGGLVVVAFIVVLVLAAIQAAGGDGRWTRVASFVAAGLLILQYLLGIGLLTSGFRNSNEHYAVALLVLVPVALQHSSGRRLSAKTQGVALVIWSLAAVFLTIIAYMTGLAGATAP
jgi:heme A synthase